MKKTTAISILATACLAVLCACGESGGGDKLTAHEWKLDRFEHADSTGTVNIPGNVTIQFSDSAMVYGNAGCNRFFSRYSTGGSDKMNIENVGSTMMWCPNMPFEDAYIKLLKEVKSYEVTDDALKLKGADDIFTFTYSRAEKQTNINQE